MPAKNVMPKFRKGQLHSGSKHGPIVTNPHQAVAIQISEARKEGENIPPAGRASAPKRKARRTR